MRHRLLLCFAFLICAAGCNSSSEHPSETITLATTTSTRDSGLLDELVPMFEKQSDIQVKVIAVGTGQALAMGRRGDADVLLTHAPAAEQQFMDDGHGSDRWPVMHNDFVLVGPKSNPAGIVVKTNIAEALRAIRTSQSAFVSRGDDSGTHMKERAIWKAASAKPSGDWYIEAGGGMAHTLRLASEKQAYTLADRGTFLALKDGLELVVACEHDPLLRNPYAVILVNQQNHPHIKHHAARKLAEFLISASAQEQIRTFGVTKYGQPLFFPLERPED